MDKPIRKRNRLSGYDYASCGSYFVTICTANHGDALCSILETEIPFEPRVVYTRLGRIACETLAEMREPGIQLQKYVIMPNHVHLLLYLAEGQAEKRQSVSRYIGRFKSLTANCWLSVCKKEEKQMGRIWQRSFHDHIVRNQRDYDRIWLYIEANPARWREDCFFGDIGAADSRKGCPYEKGVGK